MSSPPKTVAPYGGMASNGTRVSSPSSSLSAAHPSGLSPSASGFSSRARSVVAKLDFDSEACIAMVSAGESASIRGIRAGSLVQLAGGSGLGDNVGSDKSVHERFESLSSSLRYITNSLHEFAKEIRNRTDDTERGFQKVVDRLKDFDLLELRVSKLESMWEASTKRQNGFEERIEHVLSEREGMVDRHLSVVRGEVQDLRFSTQGCLAQLEEVKAEKQRVAVACEGLAQAQKALETRFHDQDTLINDVKHSQTHILKTSFPEIRDIIKTVSVACEDLAHAQNSMETRLLDQSTLTNDAHSSQIRITQTCLPEIRDTIKIFAKDINLVGWQLATSQDAWQRELAHERERVAVACDGFARDLDSGLQFLERSKGDINSLVDASRRMKKLEEAVGAIWAQRGPLAREGDWAGWGNTVLDSIASPRVVGDAHGSAFEHLSARIEGDGLGSGGPLPKLQRPLSPHRTSTMSPSPSTS